MKWFNRNIFEVKFYGLLFSLFGYVVGCLEDLSVFSKEIDL